MNLLIEMLVNMIFVASMTILNFVIFKMRVKKNYNQIVIISLAVGFVNYYFKFIVGEDSSYFLIQISVNVILLMILRRYPLFYAFLVCAFGSIAISLIDAIVTISALRLNLSSIELMRTDVIHFSTMHLTTSLIALLIAFILRKTNIGFSFIKDKFSGAYSLNVINFIWAVILSLSMVVSYFSSKKFDLFSLHTYIIIFISLSLIIGVSYAWWQNKKHVKSRYRNGVK